MASKTSRNPRPIDLAQDEILADPWAASAYGRLALALAEADRSVAAGRAYERLIAIAPESLAGWVNWASLAYGQADWPTARSRLEQAAILVDRLAGSAAQGRYGPIVWRNLGRVASEQGDYDRAEAAFRRAIDLEPDNPINTIDLGNLFARQNLLAAEQATYATAIDRFAIVPQSAERWEQITLLQTNYGLVLLRAGDWAAGLAAYEWRLGQPPGPRLIDGLIDRDPAPGLAGGPTGRPRGGRSILLTGEMGFGDTIQFLRYGPLLAAQGWRPIAQIQRPLVDLARSIPDLAGVFPDDEPLPTAIAQDLATAPRISLPSLPYHLGTTLANLPRQVPYLRVPPGVPVGRSIPGLPGSGDRPSQPQRLNVGIVWASGRRDRPELAAFQRRKSAPIEVFLRHLRLPHVQVYSLQVGDDAAELTEIQSVTRHNSNLDHTAEPVIDLSPHLQDFSDTARAIAALDLIITVDTAVAHLAGALGRPVWLVLSYWADWRWLVDRSDSPWYPTMRLFRQPREGDWDGVLGAIGSALRQLRPAPPSLQ